MIPTIFYFKSRSNERQLFLSPLTGVAGFEPTNGGVKVRSLTTWRHPMNIEVILIFIIGQEGIRTPDTVVRSHVL